MIDFLSIPLFRLPFAWAEYSFMHNALLAMIIISPVFACIGCLVVNNQMAFFSDAIGHSALTGIAIGTLFGITEPLVTMSLFAILLAIGITLLRRHSAASVDTIIGIVMACALAIGIAILSRGGGFNKYSRYLIGDILTVSSVDLQLLSGVALLVLFLAGAAFNRLLLIATNSSLARSRRIPVWLIESLFAAITALTVTITIQWIGILVINAMLILPATAARNIARTTAHYLGFAVIFSLIAGIAGLIASYYLSTAAGATIVIAAMIIYGGTVLLRFLRQR